MKPSLLLYLTTTVTQAFSLSCWENSDCPGGDQFCLLQCPSQQACTANFQISGRGTVSVQNYGCFDGPSSCDNTRCEYHIIDATGVYSCCCDSDGCNPPGNLIAGSPYTVPPPPSPDGTPPLPEPDHIICEVYSPPVHKYVNCPLPGHCGASLRLGTRSNYELESLYCNTTTISNISQCVLNTSNLEEQVVQCPCGGNLCNSVEDLIFSDASKVAIHSDGNCNCSHKCIYPAAEGVAPFFCICQHGYILDGDGTTCVDVNECDSSGMNSCSHICLNTDGGYSCACPLTSFLGSDGRTCQNSSIICAKLTCDGEPCPDYQHCDLQGSVTADACSSTYREINNIWTPSIGTCFTNQACGSECRLTRHPTHPSLASCCCTGSKCNDPNNVILPPDLPDLAATTTSLSISSTFGSLEEANSTASDGTTLILTTSDAQILTAVYIIVVVVVVVLILILSVVGVSCYCRKRHKDCSLQVSLPLHNLDLDPVGSVQYEYKDKLGSGRYADVYKGVGSNAKFYAMKVFRTDCKGAWEKETEIYNVLGQHPNVLKYWGRESSPDMMLILEYHPTGSLLRFLTKEVISFEEFITMGTSLASGLIYVHGTHGNKPQIAHRDIKSSNILINDRKECVLSDFGLAITLPLEDSSGIGQDGTPRYMAPEIIEGAIESKELSLLEGDTYSSGLVYWELLSRTYPPHISPDQIPPYKPPYDEFVEGVQGAYHPPTITIEIMAGLFAQGKRPTIPTIFKTKPEYDTIVETIEECWGQEQDSRITSTCVRERFISYNSDSGVSTFNQGAGKSSPSSPAPSSSLNTSPPPPTSSFHNETTV